MEQTTHSYEVVGREIQAYVNSLVSALGGIGADEDGHYMLGDDALACLKDLRRWLKLYDERTNRLDVARCLAKANLVNGDLLEILSLWPEDALDDRYMSKIALACLELLVPLTWPLEKTDAEMTVNHHRHLPHLQEAQLSYKRGVLNHSKAKILRTIVRIGLPSMAVSLYERSGRDEGVIKLILYFLRNMAIISPTQKLQSDTDDNEISRSSTIDAFHYQDVLHLLLTIASSMGGEFSNEDVVILEILYHLLKGVDTERLFMSSSQLESKRADELQDLLDKEAGMLRSYARYAPTRHNRFGTMIWIKRDDDRVSTVSGQDVLMDSRKGLAKIDETKKWKKAKPATKRQDEAENDVDVAVPLTESARKHLRHFVEEFLDSAFNPLFQHIHKAIEREADRVLHSHSRQYFYLISWFLGAERARRKAMSSVQEHHQGRTDDTENTFALIAAVLTQESFITLSRFMQKSYDNHEWQDLKTGMKCLTRILLTVQEMSQSTVEEDQTIAENILSRLFYEETTHDRIISIVRSYSTQDFGYLDACTELAHVHLRMLEQYSKQNVEMQVRSRRIIRKRKKAAATARSQEKSGANDREDDQEEASEREEVASAQRISSERRFDFTRFAARFMTQSCVDTFVSLTRFYKDLTSDQLKRAHRFFHRVAFKMEMSVMLFRVDIIALFNKMIKGQDCLNPVSIEYKEWSELVRQLFKRMIRMIEQRPQLIVEMLFSKIGSTVPYLEHGHEISTASAKTKAPAELQVKPGFERDRQVGIAVSVLIDQNKADAVEWIEKVLSSAADTRKGWEAEREARSLQEGTNTDANNIDRDAAVESPSIVVKPDTEERRMAMLKDNKLRLLMTLVGFQQLDTEGDAQGSWIVPSTATSTELNLALDWVKQAVISPPQFEEGKTAEDFIRRKLAPRARRAEYDDDSDGDSFVDYGADLQFPAGGPTKRKSDALEDLKKKRERKKRGEGEGLNDEEREARAKARRVAQAEMQRKIKSDLFVHDSDEEENERDQAFFAKEEETRMAQSRRLLRALDHGNTQGGKESIEDTVDREVLSGVKKKRKQGGAHKAPRKRQKKTSSSSEDDDQASIISNDRSHSRILSDSDVPTDTPISSPHRHSSQESGSLRTGLRSSRAPSPAAASKLPIEDGDISPGEKANTNGEGSRVSKRKTNVGRFRG